jgi:AcrR family transcriptional regulator
MVMGRRSPAPRDTRERILEAALAEFGAQGYAGASIDEIAARAGVTKGAVYYWFTDKDDLARDLQTSLWERLKHDALAAFDPAAGTVDNLNACFDAYLGSLQILPEARFFLREVWAIPGLDTSDRMDAYDLVRDILSAGIERGEIAALDARAMAHVLVGMYEEATLHILQTGDPGPTVEVVRHLVGALAPARAKRTTRADR